MSVTKRPLGTVEAHFGPAFRFGYAGTASPAGPDQAALAREGCAVLERFIEPAELAQLHAGVEAMSPHLTIPPSRPHNTLLPLRLNRPDPPASARIRLELARLVAQTGTLGSLLARVEVAPLGRYDDSALRREDRCRGAPLLGKHAHEAVQHHRVGDARNCVFLARGERSAASRSQRTSPDGIDLRGLPERRREAGGARRVAGAIR
jgi:hypothetical protein